MSLERVFRALEGFGFSRADAEVYVYLAKQGPKSGSDISDALKIRRRQLHSVLSALQDKGVVSASSECEGWFSAVAFEEALSLLLEADVEQAEAIKETREELLSEWRSMISRVET